MRIAMRVLLIFALLTALSFGADRSRRVVLEQANLGQRALEKTVSSRSETGFSFRLAGVELSDKAVSERTYQEISVITDTPEKYGETGEEGLPDLPVYSQLVAIPDMEGVQAEIISSSYQTIEDVDAYPFQPSPLDGESDETIPFTKDDNFYQTDQFYPPEIVSLGEPIICRDLRMIQSVVNPVQYNPVRKELRVYTSIDYRLVYEGTDMHNAKIRRDNHISETFMPMYRAMVPNADEMLADYEPIKGGYLIITPNAYPDSLIQLLAQWKHLKGYSVVVARATDINPGGSPSNTQVFNYIQTAYNSWAVPPEFVCIIGDVGDGIPDYGFSGYTSDHHYGCVDGSDYFLDVFVSRISVNNSFPTVRVALYKPVIYEKTPFMGDPAYWRRGLCAAANITSGSLPSVTPRLNVLWAREMMMRMGYTQVDTTFAWSGYDPGPAAAIASLNNGVSIINYRGWGSSSCWGGPGLCISHLEALTGNNKMGIMASLTCGTGEYGYSECFTEKWIRMGSLPSGLKGGPGSYGATESGTHNKYNNPIMIGYIWAFTNQDIYNFTLAAFMGKVELYNTFPRANGPGSWVERYCHTFNPLGEPEFEMRTATPQTMLVSYPNPIPVGASMLTVHVSGNADAPLEGAYVNLIKGRTSEEVFVGGKTDASGNITLDFSTTTADTMFVTVTARDYIPHVGYTVVQAQPVAVNINSITLDDDNNGASHGNSDGNANPSETVEFNVVLRNFGNSTTATNVAATLSSPDPNVYITVPTQSYGSIGPGGTATSGKFAALLSPNIPQGEHYILLLNITSDQGSWTGAVPMDIKNMLMSVTSLEYPGNSNNRIDPGETSDLVVNLRNTGELAGTALTGVLTTSDTGIVIIDGTADFGNINIGGVGSNTASPFVIQARSRVYQGRNVNFNLALTSSNGSVVQRPFYLVVGNISTFDPVGPDSYGYYLYDNTDGSYSACPIYNWVEISPYLGGSGTRIDFPFSVDDDAVVINLPFSFRYYGVSHTYALVSINGFIAFDTTRFDIQGHHWSAFDNGQIPEPSAPDGIIAPFWDDLEYTGNNGVFRYYDVANHRFIIEWTGCTHPQSGTSETFEMMIYDQASHPTPTGDCEMVFQYNVVHNDDNDGWDGGQAPGLYSTVGIQNYTNDDGLEYTYDNLYHPGAAILQTGRAIKVTTVIGMQPPPEIAYDPGAFIKTVQVGQTVTDTLTVSNLSGGLLNFTLSEFTDNRLLDGGDKDSAKPATTAVVQPIAYIDIAGAKPGDERQPLYPPVILNHGGPDTYGNMWVDSDDGGGPAYNWVDISGIGTPANITSDDGYVGPISMGIDFSFYGNSYSSIFISANGILTFGTGTGSYSNQVIPSSGAPNNFIAPLWDDLSPQNGGSVKYYHDTVNNRFIISYTNTPFFSGGGNVNFEAILYPSGRILFEYASLDGGTRGLNSCTIGIENGDGSDGLQVVCNADYLHSNMAIMIYPPNFWLVSNLHTASLLAGQDTMAIITFDATNLTAGTYTGHLDLDSNDPVNGSIDIPVSFTVGGGGTPNIVQTPSSFTDTLQTGQSASFNIRVRNTGSGVLTVAFSSGNAWISTVAGPYSVPIGDSLLHSVTLDATGLAPGTYNGSVVTTTNDPVHPSITLPVQLLVTAPPPPNISYRPSAINDTLLQGASITWDLIIKNTGGSPLNLTLSAVEGSMILGANGNSGSVSSPTILSNGDGGGEPPHILNDWLFISPAADTIAVNDSLIAEITLAATVVAPGSHVGHIALVSNDPDTPNASIPVTLLVQSGGPGCVYTVGDANGNGAFNGLDVTYSVAYFKGGPPPPYSCECPLGGPTWYVAGDVNNSCSFNGLDVTYMVAYFKGGPVPHPCPQCPPTYFLDGNHQQSPAGTGQ